MVHEKLWRIRPCAALGTHVGLSWTDGTVTRCPPAMGEPRPIRTQQGQKRNAELYVCQTISSVSGFGPSFLPTIPTHAASHSLIHSLAHSLTHNQLCRVFRTTESTAKDKALGQRIEKLRTFVQPKHLEIESKFCDRDLSERAQKGAHLPHVSTLYAKVLSSPSPLFACRVKKDERLRSTQRETHVYIKLLSYPYM